MVECNNCVNDVDDEQKQLDELEYQIFGKEETRLSEHRKRLKEIMSDMRTEIASIATDQMESTERKLYET